MANLKFVQEECGIAVFQRPNSKHVFTIKFNNKEAYEEGMARFNIYEDNVVTVIKVNCKHFSVLDSVKTLIEAVYNFGELNPSIVDYVHRLMKTGKRVKAGK